MKSWRMKRSFGFHPATSSPGMARRHSASQEACPTPVQIDRAKARCATVRLQRLGDRNIVRRMRPTLLLVAATTLSLAQPPMHGPGGGHVRVVTGAPYSAKIITSSTQTLGDGSHISRNST